MAARIESRVPMIVGGPGGEEVAGSGPKFLVRSYRKNSEPKAIEGQRSSQPSSVTPTFRLSAYAGPGKWL